jgi:hypothetical protein
MNATMDGYTQMNIMLTKGEAKKLYKTGKLSGKLWRADGKGGQHYLPLKLKVSEIGWRAEGLPRKAFYQNKKSYEIDIPPDGPKKILGRKVIGTDMTAVSIRKLYISLDSVIDYGD